MPLGFSMKIRFWIVLTSDRLLSLVIRSHSISELLGFSDPMMLCNDRPKRKRGLSPEHFFKTGFRAYRKKSCLAGT
jgi:hypothetical protein